MNKPFKCDFEGCDFSSHAKKYLKAHVFNCHEKDKYQCECDQCGKKFPFPHVLREHKEVEHDGIKRYMCDKCGKGFLRKNLFDDHVLKDTCNNPNGVPSEPVKCDLCDETFSGKRYLTMHIKANHETQAGMESPKKSPKKNLITEEFKDNVSHTNKFI